MTHDASQVVFAPVDELATRLCAPTPLRNDLRRRLKQAERLASGRGQVGQRPAKRQGLGPAADLFRPTATTWWRR